MKIYSRIFEEMRVYHLMEPWPFLIKQQEKKASCKCSSIILKF